MTLPTLQLRHAFVIARWLLAVMFAESAISHCLHYEMVLLEISAKGLPYGLVLLPMSILTEMVAVVLLIVGRGLAIASILLIGFTVTSTLLFFPFWMFQGPEHAIALQNFVKNMSVIGTLLLIYAYALPQSSPKSD